MTIYGLYELIIRSVVIIRDGTITRKIIIVIYLYHYLIYAIFLENKQAENTEKLPSEIYCILHRFLLK